MTPPVIRLQALHKSFAGKPVLHGIDLDIAHGEFLTLLGPSGCGKTTVLRLVAGFEAPDAGRVEIDGSDVADLPPDRRHVNTVFQNYALFPHLSVQDNVAFGLRMKQVPRDEIAARVREALATVQLAGMETRRPHQLSGGQQQRVALARALVNRPRVLLLDESLSALDYTLRKQMQGELKALQRQLGIAFVFVTHDQEEALAMSDRVALLNAGRLAQCGSPRDVYERPASLFVARFVGEANIFTVTTGTGATEHLVVRPEDLNLHVADAPPATHHPLLAGRLLDRTYKGMMLDTRVQLDDGTLATVSHVFNENLPEAALPLAARVQLSWIPGRETRLPPETS